MRACVDTRTVDTATVFACLAAFFELTNTQTRKMCVGHKNNNTARTCSQQAQPARPGICAEKWLCPMMHTLPVCSAHSHSPCVQIHKSQCLIANFRRTRTCSAHTLHVHHIPTLWCCTTASDRWKVQIKSEKRKRKWVLPWNTIISTRSQAYILRTRLLSQNKHKLWRSWKKTVKLRCVAWFQRVPRLTRREV